jgi:acyl-coenzyme A synthetase/AMP-(fatty) acid ligase
MKLSDEGCLCIRSPHAETDEWVETADRCRMLSDRTFVLEGRADRVVKVEEKRISLPEIEQHVQALKWISEAAVLPLEQQARQILCAVITLSDKGRRKMEELGRGRFGILLRTELRRCVEPVGIPRRYRVVDQIPINPQGKHSLREMKMMFDDTAAENE